ncbi:MAG: CMD domain protein [Microvirgula sp.]
MTFSPPSDVIDLLAGVQPGDAVDRLRSQRPQARLHAQQSYLALFAPAAPVPGQVEPDERFAIAAFVTALHRQDDAARFYADALAQRDAGLAVAVAAIAAQAAGQGPYGHYPAGPLSVEGVDGPRWRADPAARLLLGERLAAGFEHAHLLVFHPRDAAAADLQALLDAGWSATDIVILTQIVAFLAFQIRVVSGLQVLATSLSPQRALA